MLMALPAILAYQNCGDGFQVSTDFGSLSLRTPFEDTRGALYDQGVLDDWDRAYPPLVRDASCMTGSRFTLCLPQKDPVTANGGAFSPLYAPGSGTQAQEYKVLSSGLKTPRTKPANRHYVLKGDYEPFIQIFATMKNGTWKHSYINGTQHEVAQLNVWYWINRQRTYMRDRTQKYFFDADTAKKQLTIRPYLDSFENAAFSRTDSSLNFGHRTIQGVKHDFALDATVIAHEAGHGNFFYANRGGGVDNVTINDDTLRASFCPTVNGCMGAIDEGIGDIHSFILFPDNPTPLGAYIANSPSGLRNAETDLASETAQSLFDRIPDTGYPKGEIHNTGQVYAAIWFGVWKTAKAAGTEKDIEILFTEHMTDLVGSDTFITAYNRVIKPNVEQLFRAQPTKVQQIKASFRAQYQKLSLTGYDTN